MVARENRTENDDHTFEQKELESYVQKQLTQLPEDMQVNLVLRYYHNLSQTEAAEVLGLPRSTVQARTQKALETLKSKLNECGLLTIIPNLESFMSATAAPVVPAHLSTVLLSIGAHAGSAASATAVTSMGGVIMSAKTMVTGAIITVLSILFGYGLIHHLFIEDSKHQNEELNESRGAKEENVSLAGMSDKPSGSLQDELTEAVVDDNRPVEVMSSVKSGGLIRGRVLCGEKPYPNIIITVKALSNVAQKDYQAVSNQEGFWEMDGLKPSMYCVMAFQHDLCLAHPVFALKKGEEKEITFNFANIHKDKITINVIDENYKPIPQAEVTIAS